MSADLRLVGGNPDLPFPGHPNDTPFTQHFLRVVHGGRDDPDRQFIAAYHEATIATAERNLAEALSLRDHWLDHGNMRHDERREIAFENQWEAVLRLAAVPARSKADLERKKRAIGKVWLKAEGARYEPLRRGVATDEAQLAGKGR